MGPQDGEGQAQAGQESGLEREQAPARTVAQCLDTPALLVPELGPWGFPNQPLPLPQHRAETSAGGLPAVRHLSHASDASGRPLGLGLPGTPRQAQEARGGTSAQDRGDTGGTQGPPQGRCKSRNQQGRGLTGRGQAPKEQPQLIWR